METSTPTVANTPHTTSVAAWDVPQTVVPGEHFRMKVGMKCAENCSLGGMTFAVFNQEGACVARGAASGDVWPGTIGLYVAEVELEAPGEEGLYTWSVRNTPATTPSTAVEEDGPTNPGSESEDEVAHTENFASFGIRVVSHPEHLVRVEAIDHDGQTPVSGAHVVMHPYKAVTDEFGVAELRVAKGSYTLFISQTSYAIWGAPIEVSADVNTRAELHLQPVLERN